jgi:hypothetical protein
MTMRSKLSPHVPSRRGRPVRRWFAARLVLLALLALAHPALAEPPEAQSRGQTVYVPVYSEVRHGNLGAAGQPDRILMSILISVRNTDPNHAIRIVRANYYDTVGKLLGNYVTQAVTVPPFGTSEFFVEQRETAGGSGANFAIEWDAAKAVSPPIIEALHARFQAGYSATFVSRGKAISSR